MSEKNKHAGSSFDNFLKEEGIIEEVGKVAKDRIESYMQQIHQINTAIDALEYYAERFKNARGSQIKAHVALAGLRSLRYQPAVNGLDKVREILERIAQRPDLPNNDRDADWKNCQKWSQADAREALAILDQQPASEVVEGLSYEAMELIPGMIEHCINQGHRMGMDQGINEKGEYHPHIQELLKFSTTPYGLYAQSQKVKPKIPEGWKLVPIEPTEEMRKAWNCSTGNGVSYFNSAYYKAMLSAAPQPDLNGEG